MRQCGLENFTIEVFEECQSQEQLNARERFWIRVLKCKVPNGYNQNNGVRLEWLETGEGEMYATRDTSVIAQLEAAGCLTPKGRELIEIYLQMPPDTQNLIADAIAAAAKYFRKETAQAEEPPVRKSEGKLTREEMHAMLDAELDAKEAAAKRGTSTSVASTNLFGLVKNRGKPY